MRTQTPRPADPSQPEAAENAGLASKLLRYLELRLELVGIEALEHVRTTVARGLFALAVFFLAGVGLVFLTLALAGLINRITETHAGDWAVAGVYGFLLALLLANQARVLGGLNHFLGKQAKALPLPEVSETDVSATERDENASTTAS